MSKIGVLGSARIDVPLKTGGSQAEECARSPMVAPWPSAMYAGRFWFSLPSA